MMKRLKWVAGSVCLAGLMATSAQAKVVELGLLSAGGTFGQAVASGVQQQQDHYTFSVGLGQAIGLSASLFFDGGRIESWSFSDLGNGQFTVSVRAGRQVGVPLVAAAAMAESPAYQWQLHVPGGNRDGNAAVAIASAAPEPGEAALAALGLTGVMLLVRHARRSP